MMSSAVASWSNNKNHKANAEEQERLLPDRQSSTERSNNRRYPYPRRSCLLQSSTESSGASTTGSTIMLNMESGGIVGGGPASSTQVTTHAGANESNEHENNSDKRSASLRRTDGRNRNPAKHFVTWSLRDSDNVKKTNNLKSQQRWQQPHYNHHLHNPSALLPSLLKLRPLEGLQRHTSCPNLVNDNDNTKSKQRRSVRWTHPKSPSELLLVGKSEKDATSGRGKREDCIGRNEETNSTIIDEGDIEKAPLLHNEIINDEEEAEGEDILIHTLDRWEDEIDTHTTDMLPLSIQLALEQNIFGWQNLSADILSHILFTGGAAFLAYNFTSWLLLNNAHHPILQWLQWYTRMDSTSTGATSSSSSRTSSRWSAMSDKNNATIIATHQEAIPVLNISRQVFETVRSLATIVAAIVAFRVVRRRRRVWFHSAYGTKAYERDALRRRVSVKEVDQTTLLGKLRQHARTKKLAKKVRKAQKRFEQKQKIMKLKLEQQELTSSNTSSHQHNLIKDRESSFLLEENSKGSNGEEERNVHLRNISSSTTTVQKRRRRTKRCKNGTSEDRFKPLLEKDIMGKPRSIYAGAGGDGESLDAENIIKSTSSLSPLATKEVSPLRRKSVRRTTTSSMIKPKTVLQDQIPVSEINVLPYAHGGFFGAAPFMLGDPMWVNLLRELMPDVYVEVAKRIFAPTPKLIHWAENNPVVAAYGTLHEKHSHGRVVTLEWDVFLDPYLVDHVVEAMEALDSFHAEHYVGEDGDNEEEEEENHSSGIEGTVKDDIKRQRKVLEKNLQSAAMVLVEKMLIAHGSSLQLMMEQMGIFKRFNFSRIKRQRRTLGGGMFARQWLAVYAQAVKMATWQEEFLEQRDSAKCHGKSNSIDTMAPELVPVLQKKNDSRRASVNDLASPRMSPAAFGFTSSEDDDDDSIDDDSVMSTTSSTGSMGASDNEDYAFLEDPLLSPPNSPLSKEQVLERAAKLSGLKKRSLASSDSNDSSGDSSVSPSRRHDSRRRRRHSSSTGKVDEQSNIHSSPRMTCSSFNQSRRPSSPSLSLSRRFGYYVPSTNMVESIDIIRRVIGEPIKLVLDLKSRHVPKEVWALVVDTLRDCGAHVEGVASFTIQEIRGLSDCCVTPCQEIVFFHSAGDVQRACHEGLVKEGDSIFFNAGSLLWDFPLMQTLQDVWEVSKSYTVDFDVERIRHYIFRSYARISCSSKDQNDQSSTVGKIETEQRFAFTTTEDVQNYDERMIAAATIADYKHYYKLNIGLYCQEFSIDDAAIDLLIRYVNTHSEIFNLGLSWGGVNGYTVKGIQPTRLTNTDGLWNQRYVGESWDYSLRPGDDYYSVTTCTSSNDTVSSVGSSVTSKEAGSTVE